MLQTGKIKQEEKLHEKEIRDMQIYKDGTHLATASVDKTVKLIDTQTLEVLKVYQTDRPSNAVALSPIFDQVSVVSTATCECREVLSTSHQERRLSSSLYTAVLRCCCIVTGADWRRPGCCRCDNDQRQSRRLPVEVLPQGRSIQAAAILQQPCHADADHT